MTPQLRWAAAWTILIFHSLTRNKVRHWGGTKSDTECPVWAILILHSLRRNEVRHWMSGVSYFKLSFTHAERSQTLNVRCELFQSFIHWGGTKSDTECPVWVFSMIESLRRNEVRHCVSGVSFFNVWVTGAERRHNTECPRKPQKGEPQPGMERTSVVLVTVHFALAVQTNGTSVVPASVHLLNPRRKVSASCPNSALNVPPALPVE